MVDFFNGGSSYNIVSFLLGVVALLLTVIGLLFGIWQLRKTRSAAEAAKEAAQAATYEVSKISALIEVSELLHYAREIISHISRKDHKLAALRALDLRVAMATFRSTEHGKRLLIDVDWQSLITKVAITHDALEEMSQRSNSNTDKSTALECHRTMAFLCEHLGQMTTGVLKGAQ